MTEVDITVVIKNLQQQISALERKIDTLIAQSQIKPLRERPFPKPFNKSYGSHVRPAYSSDQKRHGHGPRENNSYAPQRFEKRPGEEHKGGYEGGPKKDFTPFKKKFGGNKPGFFPKGKPSFHK